MILAGDIGGTKCNFALYESRAGRLLQIAKRKYPSHDYPSFDLVIARVLQDCAAEIAQSDHGKIHAAGLGVAGPVIDRRVKATNLPWIIDAATLAQQLSTEHVVLLNDLESTGYSVHFLGPGDCVSLNEGVPAPHSTQALIAAGTGLGEAILFWNGERYAVASSEGGHADFAPRNEPEIGLLRTMKKLHPFVSVELILSGRGFRTIHEFLDPSVRHPSFDIAGEDPAPEISALGLEGKCPVCVQTLEMWASMYGAEAGNLALKVLARGGVWIAGGIAAKLRKKMEDGTFFRAFCEKEAFAAMLAQVPIYLVLNEDAPLLGAASQAARAAGF
jgi:glucokinase